MIVLWICFLTVIGIVSYLSFQDGEEAKTFGKRFIQYIAERKYQGNTVSEEDMQALTYEIRQTGRVVIFFLLGILGTVTIHVSFRRWNWFIKTGITGFVLIIIACLTEKLKIYIPSRHYSYEEMMYSIAAVSMGFLLVSVLTLLICLLKSFFRLIITAAHS